MLSVYISNNRTTTETTTIKASSATATKETENDR